MKNTSKSIEKLINSKLNNRAWHKNQIKTQSKGVYIKEKIIETNLQLRCEIEQSDSSKVKTLKTPSTSEEREAINNVRKFASLLGVSSVW